MRSSLHLSPLSPLKVKGGRRRGEEEERIAGSSLDSVLSA